MWKESIAVALFSIFTHERRKKNSYGYPNDRRRDDGKLTMKKARNTLRDSLEHFSETVFMSKKK